MDFLLYYFTVFHLLYPFVCVFCQFFRFSSLVFLPELNLNVETLATLDHGCCCRSVTLSTGFNFNIEPLWTCLNFSTETAYICKEENLICSFHQLLVMHLMLGSGRDLYLFRPGAFAQGLIMKYVSFCHLRQRSFAFACSSFSCRWWFSVEVEIPVASWCQLQKSFVGQEERCLFDYFYNPFYFPLLTFGGEWTDMKRSVHKCSIISYDFTWFHMISIWQSASIHTAIVLPTWLRTTYFWQLLPRLDDGLTVSRSKLIQMKHRSESNETIQQNI